MPLLQIKTNTSIAQQEELAKAISQKAAEILGKPESYVMVTIDDQQTLIFAGTDEPAAYIELKSINLPESETAQISSQLCELIHAETYQIAAIHQMADRVHSG